MTTPHAAAKRLGRVMKIHIMNGISGITNAQIRSLERRGILSESERRPGFLELSPLGKCVRTMLRGYHVEAMGDVERIAYFRYYREFAYEWDECDRHSGHGSVFTWEWTAEDDDHESAITDSCPYTIAGCPLCNAEYDDDYGDGEL